MAKLMCLVCGRLSDQSRCPSHRTKQARGYGKEHESGRKQALLLAPYCWNCLHSVSFSGSCGDPNCNRCPLQWHHVSELRGGRGINLDSRRQLLCRQCHLAVKERN